MIKNQKILITGGAGCLGRSLAMELAKNNEVVVYSRNEERQFFMKEEINNPKIIYRLGDIRDHYLLSQALYGCDIAVHAAAMKDLIFCEDQPTAAYLNNIEGSRAFIETVKHSSVKKVVAISTDKAAAPSNLYGMTKYIMERMFVEANQSSDKIFCNVRFGNMIDSAGSLISFWKNNPNRTIKLTHPDMERFFFKVKDAVRVVMDGIEKGQSGEIFIPKMKKAKVIEILKTITGKSDFEIIGLFPGEKIYEDLISENESRYCFDEGNYYVVRSGKINEKHPDPFSTKNAETFTPEELHNLIYQ